MFSRRIDEPNLRTNCSKEDADRQLAHVKDEINALRSNVYHWFEECRKWIDHCGYKTAVKDPDGIEEAAFNNARPARSQSAHTHRNTNRTREDDINEHDLNYMTTVHGNHAH